MLKVSDAVRDILFSSDIPLEAFRSGVLNLSAYAEQIKPEVESRTHKPVQTNTITVALSRLREEVLNVPPMRPHISFEQLSIQPSLIDISYEKTQQNLKGLAKLATIASELSFVTFSEGMNEITIIVLANEAERVMSCFTGQPKAVIKDVVGVSVRFSEKYLIEPNLIYAILAVLASKRINLLEIVSTYTELTMVIEKDSLEKTINELQKYLNA